MINKDYNNTNVYLMCVYVNRSPVVHFGFDVKIYLLGSEFNIRKKKLYRDEFVAKVQIEIILRTSCLWKITEYSYTHRQSYNYVLRI